jgi:hypothetical protein
MLMNAGLGSGGAAMITSRESHTFVRCSSVIPLRVDKEGGGIEHDVIIPTERTCACPGPKQAGVLPTFEADGNEADESSVEWTLVVLVKRKGILKRDIKSVRSSALNGELSGDADVSPDSLWLYRFPCLPSQDRHTRSLERPLHYSHTRPTPPLLRARLLSLPSSHSAPRPNHPIRSPST